MRCKYAIPSKHYQKESCSCKNNDAARGYSGLHREFKDPKLTPRLATSNDFYYK